MRLLMLLVVLGAASGFWQETQAGDAQKQTELDQKCEAARQAALAPLRQGVLEECLGKGKDKSVCQGEANDYNGARIGRGPMFYDLPACEEALEYKKNNGS